MFRIGNNNIDIMRLDESILLAQKDKIFNIMKELNSTHDEFYYRQKMNDMEMYVKDKSAIIYVALDKGIVVGYIWGYIRDKEGVARIHITQFVVDSGYRNLGIGADLLEYLEDWARENGYKEIELNVSPYNYDGIRFYINNGFSSINTLMTKRVDI